MTTSTPAAITGRRLLLDVAAPFALYYLLHACGLSDVLALSIGAGLSLVTTGVDTARRHRIEAFSAITVLALVAGLLVALISGDPRELLIRNAWISAPFAVITLASLRADRPLTYLATWMLLRRRRETMERLWRTEARFRAAWRNITIMWGVLALVDAAARVLVAYRLPVSQVPAADAVITVVTMLALQVPTHLFLLRSGLWLDLFGHPRTMRHHDRERVVAAAGRPEDPGLAE